MVRVFTTSRRMSEMAAGAILGSGGGESEGALNVEH